MSSGGTPEWYGERQEENARRGRRRKNKERERRRKNKEREEEEKQREGGVVSLERREADCS